MVNTDNPRGEWSAPILVKKALGNIDLSVLWDAMAKVYMVYGTDYATLAVVRGEDSQLILRQPAVKEAGSGFPRLKPESEVSLSAGENLYLRAEIQGDATAQFSYSLYGRRFKHIGQRFELEEGRWVDVQIGLYANRYRETGQPGSSKVDWFRMAKQ